MADTGKPTIPPVTLPPGKLREECEKRELMDGLERGEIWYVLQLIVNIRLADMLEVKFFWKRIPTERKTSLLKLLHEIAKSVKQMKPKAFYKHFADLQNQLSSSSPEVLELVPHIQGLISDVRQHFERLMLNSYEIISLQKVSETLGLDEPKCREYVQTKGWIIDDKDYITLVQPPLHRDQKTGLKQLEQLASYVIHLESNLS